MVVSRGELYPLFITPLHERCCGLVTGVMNIMIDCDIIAVPLGLKSF